MHNHNDQVGCFQEQISRDEQINFRNFNGVARAKETEKNGAREKIA